MERATLAKFTIKLSAIFFGTILVCLLAAPFLGIGWHLFHGNLISFGGWRIPVPNGYYVTQTRNGPAMFRLSIGAPVFEVPFGHLAFSTFQFRSPFEAGTDYPLFEKTMVEDAVKSGYRFESRQIIPIGDKSAYCVEFSRSTRQPRSSARCAIENTKMFVFFEGDPRYLPDLRSTLQGIHAENVVKQ